MKSKKYAQPQEYDRNLIGYARVSTEEQNLDLQIDALIRAGVDPVNVFSEKISGVSLKRPERDFAVKQCRAGSTFVVWKLDRVGRSLLDLLHFVQSLEKQGIGFKSLQDSIDTTTPAGRVMLAMLGAFAQFERDLIAERTRAGVARAMSRGVKFGQPTKVTPDIKKKIEDGIRNGDSIKEIANRLELAEATIRLRYNRNQIQKIRDKAKR